MQIHIPDQWHWQFDSGEGYTFRSVYQMLTGQEPHNFTAILDLIWHRDVPLKVSTFVWRLLRNKLPTKDNLVRRSIIPHGSQFCVSGCGNVETTQHLLLS
jgi:hypothetical protein